MTHIEFRELYPWPGETEPIIIEKIISLDWDLYGFWYKQNDVMHFKYQSDGGDSIRRCDSWQRALEIWYEQIEFLKNFWEEKLSWPDGIRIDGQHYKVGKVYSTSTPNYCKGFAGHRFKIEKFDGTVIETDNLWHQGRIPPAMSAQLPDNAEFINE